MSVRVNCSHCQTPCLVEEKHLRHVVKCSRCSRTFVAQPSTAIAGDSKRTPVSGPCLDIGSATSAGRIRKRNEDSFLVQHHVWAAHDGLHEAALLTIADGMGGHEAGHEASCLVIQTVGRALSPFFMGLQSGELLDATPDLLKKEVDDALKEANRQVLKRSQSNPASKGMGAAVVVMLIWDGNVSIAHAGDCRVYHQRGGSLTQVTQDHSLVARMVQLGQLSQREAENHPRKNELTQAVGKHPDLRPELVQLNLATGDWLLLACDGLHADLDDNGLRDEMKKPVPSAAARARQLVDLSNKKGGSDNCTVIAVCSR